MTVYFQVGGNSGESGNLVFHLKELNAPPNDNFANAIPLTDANLPYHNAENITLATTEPDESIFVPCFEISPTVWYGFTASHDITVVADTQGSDFYTGLDGWTG